MKDILDLRFVIGLFFLLVGIFLLIGSFVITPAAGKPEVANMWSGIVYIVFSVFMLILWLIGRNKIVADAEDEPEV